jgi:carbonic anhydrase
LKAGNQRFVAGQLQNPHMSAAWRNRLVSAQHPIAVLVGCSDSRVPTELVFDQGFGDLFVIRNAGHVMTTDVIGSIAYAVRHLDVHLVVIMGHEGCGAVTAALDAEGREKEPLELQEVLRLIDPALVDVPRTGDPERRVAAAVEANVRYSHRQLTELLVERGLAGKLDALIAGAVYSLKTGAVNFLE